LAEHLKSQPQSQEQLALAEVSNGVRIGAFTQDVLSKQQVHLRYLTDKGHFYLDAIVNLTFKGRPTTMNTGLSLESKGGLKMGESLLLRQEVSNRPEGQEGSEVTAADVMCGAARRFSEKFGVDTDKVQRELSAMNLPGVDIPVVPCAEYGMYLPEERPIMRHLWAI
jgi:hypothetical protein